MFAVEGAQGAWSVPNDVLNPLLYIDHDRSDGLRVCLSACAEFIARLGHPVPTEKRDSERDYRRVVQQSVRTDPRIFESVPSEYYTV